MMIAMASSLSSAQRMAVAVSEVRHSPAMNSTVSSPRFRLASAFLKGVDGINNPALK